MPTLSDILNGHSKLDRRGIKVLETSREELIKVANRIIETAIEQKKDNVLTIEVISLASYWFDGPDPIISNQGSLLLQEDANMNEQDRKLMENLARHVPVNDKLAIFIITMTERIKRLRPLTLHNQVDIPQMTLIKEPKLIKYINAYLDGISYKNMKYTRSVVLQKSELVVAPIKRTCQCYLLWPLDQPGHNGESHQRTIVTVLVLIALFFLAVIFCLYMDEIRSVARFLLNKF